MDQKRRAEDKRKRRIERKAAGPGEPPPNEVCRPYTDDV